MSEKQYTTIKVSREDSQRLNTIFPDNTIVEVYEDSSEIRIADGVTPFNSLAPISNGGSLPLNSRIVGLGDSIVGFWLAVVSATRSNYQNKGFMLHANIKNGNRFYMPVGGGKGVPGNTTGDMVNRLGATLALNPAVTVLLGGTNDLVVSGTSAQTIINNLSRLYKGLVAARSKVIFLTIFPRYAPNVLTEAGEAKRQVVNNWIRQQASEDVIVVDLEQVLSDITLFEDGLHPNSQGASVIGGYVAAELDKLIKKGTPTDIISIDGSYNINPYFTGTTGTLSNGVTGVAATSYELDRGTTGATVVGSIDNVDGVLSQKIDISGTYTGTNPMIALKCNSTINPPITGDTIEALADFKINTNDANILGFNVNYNVYTSAFASLARGDSFIALDQVSNVLNTNKVYTLRAPSVIVGAGTATRVALEFNTVLKNQTAATPINASITIHKIGARKVPSNL